MTLKNWHLIIGQYQRKDDGASLSTAQRNEMDDLRGIVRGKVHDLEQVGSAEQTKALEDDIQRRVEAMNALISMRESLQVFADSLIAYQPGSKDEVIEAFKPFNRLLQGKLKTPKIRCVYATRLFSHVWNRLFPTVFQGDDAVHHLSEERLRSLAANIQEHCNSDELRYGDIGDLISVLIENQLNMAVAVREDQ